MGSGCDAVHETVDFLHQTTTEKIGVLKVRLYSPFDASRFVAALPKTVKRIAVLDRTKEPGSMGEPLYLRSGHRDDANPDKTKQKQFVELLQRFLVE